MCPFSPNGKIGRMDRVSVLIATHNLAGFIREAVDSALAQNYPNTEVLVVDDGSTDHTGEILTPYIRACLTGRQAGRIRYIALPAKSLAAAWNAGITAATGEYIAFLEARDMFLPGKLHAQVEHLQKNPQADVSYCAPYHFEEGKPNELLTLKYRYYSGREVFPKLLRKFFIAPSTVVARKEFLLKTGGFNESLPLAEDLEFWLRATHHGANMQFLNVPLVKIRICGEECARGIRKEPLLKLMALRGLENLEERLTKEEHIRYKINSLLFSFRLKVAFASLLAGRKSEAKIYFKEAFSRIPGGAVLALLLWMPFALLPAGLLSRCARLTRSMRRANAFRSA